MTSNITKTIYRTSDFLSWQRAKSLILSPSFQRRPVWEAAAKSYFIDTITRGLPIPIIFLREQTNLKTLEPSREVVDGQQRLRTLLTYIEPHALADFDEERDRFEVKKSHNPELAGKTFSDLPQDLRRRILGYEFSVHILPSGTDDTEVLQIFARMNATGIKLNYQELRNAKFYGEFKYVSYSLAYEQLKRWRDWKIFSESEIARMLEVEEASDLIILIIDGIHGRNRSIIDRYYQKYDVSFPQAEIVSNRFRSVMNAIDRTLGETLPQTVFSRKALFNTLFSFYYGQMYGIHSPLEPKSSIQITKKAVNAALAASDEIQNGRFNEEVAKVLRGATSHASSRQTRLDFILGIMEGAQAKLDTGDETSSPIPLSRSDEQQD